MSADDWINFQDDGDDDGCSIPCFKLGEGVRTSNGEGPVCWIGESKRYRGTCRVGVRIDGEIQFFDCRELGGLAGVAPARDRGGES